MAPLRHGQADYSVVHLGTAVYVTASRNNWSNWIPKYALDLLINLMARFALKDPMNYWGKKFKHRSLLPGIRGQREKRGTVDADQEAWEELTAANPHGAPVCPTFQRSKELLHKSSLFLHPDSSSNLLAQRVCRSTMPASTHSWRWKHELDSRWLLTWTLLAVVPQSRPWKRLHSSHVSLRGPSLHAVNHILYYSWFFFDKYFFHIYGWTQRILSQGCC